MKRTLVKYERFEQLKNNSFSGVMKELTEAEEHLARTLDLESLVMESFNDSDVIYQKGDGTYLKAKYTVEDEAVTFDDLEELVLDEVSETNKRREAVANMLEAILGDKQGEAEVAFEKYMEFASSKIKRDGTLLPPEALEESDGAVRLYNTRGKNGAPKLFKRKGSKDEKKSQAAKKGHRANASSYRAGGRKRHANLSKERTRRKSGERSYSKLHALSGGKQYTRGKKHMNEWISLTNNVFQYADIVENGYVLQESVVRTDAAGHVIGVKIPSSKIRNEGKIIKMHYEKMIKQDSPKVMRENGLRLAGNPKFGAAVTELKRHNNLSDDTALTGTLDKIVKVFPSVLYLTQDELSKSIHQALESAGVTNFVDAHCGFMAEGILRTAHKFYEDSVSKLFSAAKMEIKENEDQFVAFQKVAQEYFPTLDEAIQTEAKVFEDLYNAVLDVRKIALESQNEEVRNIANEFISELESILKGEARGDIELATDVAEWLQEIVEANLPGASEKWELPKTPHHTVVGDHPQMAKNAKVGGVPGEYPGDWGDPAPMIGQDSMSWNHGDEARNRSWGNKGGKDVWPSLSNPNIPSPYGDFTMKGEKGADKDGDSDWSRWQSGDTWPALQNPYVPKALIPKQTVDRTAGAVL